MVAAIVLVARTLAYALAPDPRAEALGQVTGGPRPVVIAAVVLGLSALLSGAVLWLSALGVRERHRLRPGCGEGFSRGIEARPGRSRSRPMEPTWRPAARMGR